MWGGWLDLIRNRVKPKKNMGMFMYNFAKKGFFVGGRWGALYPPPPPFPVLTPVHLNIHCIYLIQDFLVIKHGRKNLYMLSLYMLTLSWACQMSSLQTGSDLEYNSSTWRSIKATICLAVVILVYTKICLLEVLFLKYQL